ncbi:annexin D3 isoform X1 [Juglans microcarpa x Juglans regia]|uniref:annexin D3 isoform X1 n=1 Tax=Juglans microcarpa x Juglans regia TaxID=2249226 RepID=UPI001B7DFFEC|nr:annexin D3 isoform X1 [Juglans microcarpa x Juglans regia]
MGTLRVPNVVPSADQDCERLKKAFDGVSPTRCVCGRWGTDEKAVIRVLGCRTTSQRRIIKDRYQQLYNESLIERLDSELSGDFRKAVILWTQDPPERDARLAKDALRIKKKGIKHLEVIVEVACASSPHHLMAVRQAYCALFDCSLEEDIASTVDMPLGKLLASLVSSYRYDKEVVDMSVARSEAATLHEAIKAKQLDCDQVAWILCTRNFFQLRATFDCYKLNHGNPIDVDIKGCGNEDLESLLKMVIWCIDSPEKHFAEVIGNSIIGLGTDEDSLTRAIVSRAEIDTMKIRGEYYNMYNSSLDNAVIGDTSGYYKNFLMTLLGAKI